MNSAERESVRLHLCAQYAGVFDEEQIDCHIKDYIGLDIANAQVAQILKNANGCSRILDIGSGYGSFVLAARQKGLDAIGIEFADFEVEFARHRLASEMPKESPELVYYHENALELPFEDESFDVVTLWNVLEHVSDYRRVLYEAIRVLRRNGYIYGLCPNYAAFRDEAHYHVPWIPLMPRKIAVLYLKLTNKDPRFFETDIFYCTNWGVLYALKKYGMKVFDARLEKLNRLELVTNKKIRDLLMICKKINLLWAVRLGLKLTFYNLFKKSIVICARKVEK